MQLEGAYESSPGTVHVPIFPNECVFSIQAGRHWYTIFVFLDNKWLRFARVHHHSYVVEYGVDLPGLQCRTDTEAIIAVVTSAYTYAVEHMTLSNLF